MTAEETARADNSSAEKRRAWCAVANLTAGESGVVARRLFCDLSMNWRLSRIGGGAYPHVKRRIVMGAGTVGMTGHPVEARGEATDIGYAAPVVGAVAFLTFVRLCEGLREELIAMFVGPPSRVFSCIGVDRRIRVSAAAPGCGEQQD